MYRMKQLTLNQANLLIESLENLKNEYESEDEKEDKQFLLSELRYLVQTMKKDDEK